MKKIFVIVLVLLISFVSFASVISDNDGAVFVTKAEFDKMKNDFKNQINNYNLSIDNKIEGAIASYLKGRTVKKAEVTVGALDVAKSLYWQNKLTCGDEKIKGQGYYVGGCGSVNYAMVNCENELGYVIEHYTWSETDAGLYGGDTKIYPFPGFYTNSTSINSDTNWSKLCAAGTSTGIIPDSGVFTGFINETDSVPTLTGSSIIMGAYVNTLYLGALTGRSIVLASAARSAYTTDTVYDTLFPDFSSTIERKGLSYCNMVDKYGNVVVPYGASGNWNTCKWGAKDLSRFYSAEGTVAEKISAGTTKTISPSTEMGGIKRYKNIKDISISALALKNVMLYEKDDDWLYSYGDKTLDYWNVTPIPANSGSINVVFSNGTKYKKTPEAQNIKVEAMTSNTIKNTQFQNDVANHKCKLDVKGYYDYRISDYYNKVLYDNGYQLKLWEGAPLFSITQDGRAKFTITIGGSYTSSAKLALSNKKFDDASSAGTTYKVSNTQSGSEMVAYNLPINSGSNTFVYYGDVKRNEIIYFKLSPSINKNPNNVTSANAVIEMTIE